MQISYKFGSERVKENASSIFMGIQMKCSGW